MFEFKNKAKAAGTVGANIPCQIVNSLLITFLESGEMHRRPRFGQRSSVRETFAIFRHRQGSGAGLFAKVESISWGVGGGDPNRTGNSRTDGQPIGYLDDVFAPAFLEGKR